MREKVLCMYEAYAHINGKNEGTRALYCKASYIIPESLDLSSLIIHTLKGDNYTLEYLYKGNNLQ